MTRQLAVSLLLLAFPRAGHAHEPAVGTSLVWPDPDAAEPSVIVSNRGLVFAERAEGERLFSLRCNEAYEVSSTEHPSVLSDGAGGLVVGVYHDVFHTSDRACSVEPAMGLPDQSLANTVRTGDTLHLATRSVSEAAGVWVSEDFGSSWSLAHENAAGEYFDALVPAPSLPSRLYGAGFATGSGTRQVVCGVSDDAGGSWEIKPLGGEITPFAVDPSNPDVVFAYEPVDQIRFRVLRSEDACATFDSVLEDVPKPTSLTGVPDGTALWLGLGTGTGGLYRSDDGGATFARALAGEINTITCLQYRQGQLWMCANRAPNTNGVWFSDDEGETLQPFMTFADVAKPVDCDDAAARALCAQAWYDFHIELHPTVPGDDAGVPDAGAPDASVPAAASPDAGTEAEAGSPVETDAELPTDGEVAEVATTAPSDGGCEATRRPGEGSAGGAWALIGALWVADRMRRRRASA